MVRISSSVIAKRRKKKVLKQTKGQFQKRRTTFRQAKRSLIKGLQYVYRDRRRKKREFRRLWIIRIKAACVQEGIAYSRFISGLIAAKVELNRKVMSEMAVSAPEAFRKLVEIAKANVGKKAKA